MTVVANNHYQGKEVVNALQLQAIARNSEPRKTKRHRGYSPTGATFVQTYYYRILFASRRFLMISSAIENGTVS